MLDGIFGFILYDYKNGNVLIARDPVGIIPLYYGLSDNNEVYICSEMKSIHDQCRVTENKNLVDIDVFPPASYFHSEVESIKEIGESNFKTYFIKSWDMDLLSITDCKVDL